MAPPRSYRTEGLTLRKSPLGEADLIITLYSKDRGKIRAVAKGARRSVSKLVGHLEPLTRVQLSLSLGRSLDVITQAQVLSNFNPLKEDLSAITKGLYVAELVDGFGSEEQSNPAIYDLALGTLEAIAGDPESELPLRFFELRLLLASGLMPELYDCVQCRQPVAPGSHRFSPNVGGVLCPDCDPPEAQIRPLSLRALKVLRLLHRNRTAKAPTLSVAPALAQELKTLLAATISYWLEKEIRSNSFMEHLQRDSQFAV